MSLDIDRLVGGLTPADGGDPRTFPAIWNETADEIEAVEGRVTTAEGDITQLQTDVSTLDTDDVTEAGNLYYTDQRADDRIAAASVGDLSDVTLTGVQDGQLLIWDAGAGALQPATLADLIQALDLTWEDL